MVLVVTEETAAVGVGVVIAVVAVASSTSATATTSATASSTTSSSAALLMLIVTDASSGWDTLTFVSTCKKRFVVVDAVGNQSVGFLVSWCQ